MRTRVIVGLAVLLASLAIFQSTVNSGTINNASLTPASVLHESTDLNVRSMIRFEATNDKNFTLKAYHAELSYTAGLDITFQIPPGATTARLDSRKRLIIIEWPNVTPGTLLSADISVASQTVGTYRITPSTLYYVDSANRKYTTSCNAADIAVRPDTTAPAAPGNARSDAADGYVQVSWEGSSSADVSGYNIYRRTPGTTFAKLNATLITSPSYQDSSVQNNAAYYYAVTAADSAGNESLFSPETGETYFDLKLRSIAASGIMAAAVGDVNGDGLADVVLSLPYTEVTRKTTVSGQKVVIYFGGNTSGIPDVVIKGERQYDNFGATLLVVDLNKDGYDDIIVGAPTYSLPDGNFYGQERGKIYVYAGGPAISLSPAYVRVGNESYSVDGGVYMIAEHLGASLSSGDVNGDGYPDIVAGAPYGGLDRSGRVSILYGNYVVGGIWEGSYSYEKKWQYMGTSVAVAGDTNGDGSREVIVGSPGDRNHTHIGIVSELAFGPWPYEIFAYTGGIADDGFGTLVSSAGDVNGDGYSDIVVQSWLMSVHYALDARMHTFFGGPEPLNQPGMTFSQSTSRILPLGDVNHDGYDDLVTDGPTVYFGNASGDNVPDIAGSAGALLAVGDVDGDGAKDLVTSSSTTLTVLSIAPYAALPDIVFTSPRYRQATVRPDITVQGMVKGGATRVLVKGQVVPIQSDGSFAADVDLVMGTNTFEVLAETPSGKISKRKIVVSRVEAAPLSLAITSPADNTVVNDAALSVSGSVSDTLASVWVNGVRAVVSQGSFTATGVSLAEGNNTVQATANDNYGQTASQSITVVLSTRGTIQGTLTDAASGAPLSNVVITITDGGGSRSATSDAAGGYSFSGVLQGSFTAAFEKSGYIRQVINGTLIAGQSLTLSSALLLIPPLTLSITSPADNAILNSSVLPVSGLVSNNALVTVNGRSASVANGAFRASLPLHEGVNTVTATAQDQYGQTISKTVTVTVAGLLDKQEIFVEPAVLVFPDIVENASDFENLVITNIGTENLLVGGIASPARPFLIEYGNCSGATLAPGGSCYLKVKFAPQQAGTFVTTLSIASNDKDHPSFTATLSGTATIFPGGYSVPDSGQKTCAGEQPRNPLSYTPNADGTVLDNNTGLLWQQAPDGQPRTRADASAYCAALKLGGQSGWRLPTKSELLGIVDYGRYQPAVDPVAFPGTGPTAYWTSTDGISGAWAVDFTAGTAADTPMTGLVMTACVLGPTRSTVPYLDNHDQTVTDPETGLMWVQPRLENTATQEGNANACSSLTLGGYRDWRAPTVKELATSRFNYCLMGDCRIWSSTVQDSSACSQGYLMDTAAVVAEPRENYHNLTCVRGGRLRQPSTAPVVSALTVTTSVDTATISWSTEQPTTTIVQYGTTTAYGTAIADQALTTSHTVILTGLTPATVYHLRITASNSAGLSTTTTDNAFTTRGVFEATTLVDIGNVTVMEVTGSYDARKPDGTVNELPRRMIAQEFLRQHPDEYDFLVFISNFDFAMPETGAQGFYLEVKNDTQGIGKTVLDNSAAFGSNGKLQGTIDIGNIAGLGFNPYDPTKFEQSLDLLAHEQLHRWAAGIRFKNPDGTLNTALLGKDGTHWSYLLDTDGSLEYGNDWKDNGDGTFTSVGQAKYYSDLDLYLMGMIDKTKVQPITLIENPAIDQTGLPQIGATITGTSRAVTVDDIIAAEGVRIPNAEDSQKTFKTAFIFITQPGTFAGNEPAAIEMLRNAWAGRFKALTGGRGTIADIAPSLTVTITSPSDGVTLVTPYTTIKGLVVNSTGNETGVTVNGIPATVTGNQFIAEHVPLMDGANTITVTATDTAGGTATSTVNINSLTAGNYIKISPTILSGIAPLDVLFRIDGTFSITNASISASGPVQPQVTQTATDEFTVRFTAEGAYTVTGSVTGPDGNAYQDSATIMVVNRNELDKILKAKWEGMKAALVGGNIASALDYFIPSSREKYGDIFFALESNLSEIASAMQDIEAIYIHENVAKYRIRRWQVVNSQSQLMTYYIYLVRDEKGLWKIDEF